VTRRVTWWIGTLFAVGSLCFLVGPFPGFVQLVGAAADGTVFFVGSVFFTSAALLQFLLVAREPRRPDWWAAAIQLAGTIFFNVDTFRAMQDGFDSPHVDRLIWAPELAGSICFLVSGLIAYVAIRDRRPSRDWRIAVVNLAGCILFMISSLAGYVVPATGDVLDLAAANVTTALGAACFLIGALWLLPRRAQES
jgi:YrhK-like protein